MSEHPTLRYGVYIGASRVLVAIVDSEPLAATIAQRFDTAEIVRLTVQDDSDLWPMNEEEREVGQAALRWIFQVAREARGTKKHLPFAWSRETKQEQVEHAFEHCRMELREMLHPCSYLIGKIRDHRADEPHVKHALTRLALLAALMEREAKPAEPIKTGT